VAISERAYQQALGYARDRVQGPVAGRDGPAPILHHPDVRRMLMTIRATTEAMRALSLSTGSHLDHAHRNPDVAARAAHDARVQLLTPVVKGWCTETSQVLTSLGIQVHGGMGYVEETGAAQHYRDARITTIYEGTTGIQANDLMGRKTLRDGGQAVRALLSDMRDTETALAGRKDLETIRSALSAGIDELDSALAWILEHAAKDPLVAGAIANAWLMLMGTVAGGWQMARAADAAARALADGAPDTEFLRAKLATASFYAEQLMPHAGAYAKALRSGAGATMGIPEEQL